MLGGLRTGERAQQGTYIRNGDDTGGLTLAGFVAWLGQVNVWAEARRRVRWVGPAR